VQAPTAITLRWEDGGKAVKKEPLVTASERSWLRAELSILSEVCPLDQGNQSACPLHEIRNWNLKEKMGWFEELSDEAILNIHTYCQPCLEIKKLEVDKDCG